MNTKVQTLKFLYLKHYKGKYLEQILFIIVFTMIGIFLFYFTKQSKNIKPSHVKKDDLIFAYEKRVKDFISKKHSKEEKILLIKTIHKELHNNIFFDDEETKQIMLRLTSL